MRDGVVTSLELDIDPPFALHDRRSYRAQPLELMPGDRLLFVTDGMLERNGIDIASLVVQSAAMHPREAVQHLIRAVREATGGKLRDDASIMCVDWLGGPPRLRTSDAGSDS